jgi:hypothetical protein
VIAASASVGRTRRDGRSDCELSRSAVHVEEWDTRDQAASARMRA